MEAAEESLSWHGSPGSPWQFTNDASQTCHGNSWGASSPQGAKALGRGSGHEEDLEGWVGFQGWGQVRGFGRENRRRERS